MTPVSGASRVARCDGLFRSRRSAGCAQGGVCFDMTCSYWLTPEREAVIFGSSGLPDRTALPRVEAGPGVPSAPGAPGITDTHKETT